MAKKDLRATAIELRRKGKSYSQIKEAIPVSKSTLSVWLKDMPLSKQKIKELRDSNPQRIERFRNTMLLKKEERLLKSYIFAKKQIRKLSKREIILAGIFLYFGEGSKTTKATTALTNTNPWALKFFIKWLHCHDVDPTRIKVKLHLYSDMDVEKQLNYWSKILSLPKKQFRKPYIKKSFKTDITYKGQYGQGTCTVLYEDVNLFNLTSMYMKYIQDTV